MEEWMHSQQVDEVHMLAKQTKQGLSDREELERQIAQEASAASKSRSFRHWIRKENLLEEKRRLLRLLERKEQIMQQQAEERAALEKAKKDALVK